MEDAEAFSFSLFNIASTSDLVMNTVGSTTLVGHLATERLSTLSRCDPLQKFIGHWLDNWWSRH